MKRIIITVVTCVTVVLSHAQLPQISLVQLATGYSSPVDIKSCGDNRLFIVEQSGYIRILYKDGTKQTSPFLNIDANVNSSGNEQGLLGLAFSPNYKQDGYFYVNYIYGSSSGSTRVSRFSVMPNDSTQANPNSEVVLLTFTQPASNHNGGNMMFGPDGYLYVSQGDGGSGNDPWGTIGNGQNKNTFLGKILRLDVTGQTTYAVPATNPFVGQTNVKEEIWAYGLRNPWRCSFDRITGDMWIGDVGQDNWEEIDFQDASSAGGENYGWRCREGFHLCPSCGQTGCTGLSFTDPVYEVPQAGGTSCSITGGYVYRGTQYGRLFGLYLFTDYCSGNFWSIRRTGVNTFDPDTLQDFTNFQYTSFGQDNLGELYIAYRGTGTGGRIYRITETSNCNPVAFISLKDTIEGCAPVTVAALRGDTLSYQWYDENGAIGGATSYQYTTQQSGWYKVKVSKLQANCEAMSDSVYIHVYDTTTLLIANPVLTTCVNSSNLNLAPNISPVGGVFAGTGISGDNFLSALGSMGSNLVTYTYTNLYGCVSESDFTVVLSDTTSISRNSSDTLICVTEPAFIMTNYVSPVGGSFSGNGVTGSSFNPGATGAGVNTIAYTYSNIAGCESRYTFNLNVIDSETVLTRNITDSVYCSNEPAFSLTGSVTPTGGTFSGNGVTGSFFNPAVAGIGVSPITYTYSNIAGCESADTFNLTVESETGLVKNVTDSTYCNNEPPFSLTGFINPIGGTFSGNGVTGSSFGPAAAGIGVSAITYTYSNITGCESSYIFNLTVESETALTKNITDSTYCINEPAFSLTGFINPTGGTFSGNGVIGSSFNPGAAGTGITTVTYTYSNIVGCESEDVFNLHVESATTLTKNITDSIYCNDEPAFSLNGFVTPTGGTFSGNGVTGNSFDPASVTVVPSSIVYKYTNNVGCVSSDSFNLIVDVCGGISDLGNEISFSIFPNPNKGIFTLEVKVISVEQSELTITDATGKVCFLKNQVLTPAKSVIPLELSQLAKGVYSVRLKGEKVNGVKNLVIE